MSVAKVENFKKNISLKSIVIFWFSVTLSFSNITQAETPELRVAFSSTVDIDDVALLLAFEAIESTGVTVIPTFFAQGELAAVAVASGQADIGTGASTVWLTAFQKGSPIVGIGSQNANGWSIMSVPSVRTCADIQGKSTAIHSEGAVSTAMLRAYIQSTCEGTEPDYLIIPGSENRTAALLAGEIEVTPVELIDSIRIMSMRPGEYHRTVDFAASLPELATSLLWVRSAFAEDHPDTVTSLLAHLYKVHQRIKDEPEWFIAQVPRFLEMDESGMALLPEIVDVLLEIDNFPVDGGLTVQGGQYTIDFFASAGRLKSGLDASKVFDLTFMDSALKSLQNP